MTARFQFAMVLALCLFTSPFAISWEPCPPLAPASGSIVDVSTVSQLKKAVDTATSGDTILIADGTYNLEGVYLWVDTPNVSIRSALFALKKDGLISEAELKELDKSWMMHKKKNGLDASGRKTETPRDEGTGQTNTRCHQEGTIHGQL